MKPTIKIGGKALPHRGGNGKILGGIPPLRHHHDDGFDTDRTGKPVKISESFLWNGSHKEFGAKFTVIISVTVNAVSLSPTGCVKSTSPTMKKGYENCIYSMNNINMSNEDKHDTNYINKNDTNTDTRKLHL